ATGKPISIERSSGKYGPRAVGLIPAGRRQRGSTPPLATAPYFPDGRSTEPPLNGAYLPEIQYLLPRNHTTAVVAPAALAQHVDAGSVCRERRQDDPVRPNQVARRHQASAPAQARMPVPVD